MSAAPRRVGVPRRASRVPHSELVRTSPAGAVHTLGDGSAYRPGCRVLTPDGQTGTALLCRPPRADLGEPKDGPWRVVVDGAGTYLPLELRAAP